MRCCQVRISAIPVGGGRNGGVGLARPVVKPFGLKRLRGLGLRGKAWDSPQSRGGRGESAETEEEERESEGPGSQGGERVSGGGWERKREREGVGSGKGPGWAGQRSSGLGEWRDSSGRRCGEEDGFTAETRRRGRSEGKQEEKGAAAEFGVCGREPGKCTIENLHDGWFVTVKRNDLSWSV